MAVVSCQECEGAVSSEAKRCPHCGAENPSLGSVARGIGKAFSIVAALCLVAVGACVLWIVLHLML